MSSISRTKPHFSLPPHQIPFPLFPLPFFLSQTHIEVHRNFNSNEIHKKEKKTKLKSNWKKKKNQNTEVSSHGLMSFVKSNVLSKPPPLWSGSRPKPLFLLILTLCVAGFSKNPKQWEIKYWKIEDFIIFWYFLCSMIEEISSVNNGKLTRKLN